MPVVPGEIMMKANMDYDSVVKAGSMLGSGAVIVMDETTDMVRVLQRVSRFYYSESCGQCTPCREGTGWLYRMVTRIVEGKGRPEDLELLDSVASRIEGRTICALGDAAAMPVRSFVKHYRHEFALHRAQAQHDRRRDGVGRLSHKIHNTVAVDKEMSEEQVNIEVNGIPLKARKGAMLIEITDAAGIAIPVFAITRSCPLPRIVGCASSRWRRRPSPCPRAHAGDGRHESLYQSRPKRSPRKGHHGVLADQPSAGLPDLRPGRRMRIAGHGAGLRCRCIAVRRTQTGGQGQEHRAIDRHRHDTLHSLHSLLCVLARKSPACEN